MRILLIITVLAQMLLGCSSTPNEQEKRYLAAQQVDKGRLYLKNSKYYKAKVAFADAIELAPDNAEIYGLAGLAAKKNADYDEALTYFKQSAELNPNDYRPYGNIGYILKKLAYFNEALTAFNKVLDINPKELRAIDDIADIYFKLNDYESCRLYIDKFEAVVLETDTNLLSNKTKRKIELSRRTHATYKKSMSNLQI